ncbi:MAG: hypothetical protein HWN67_00415 [Candidatus Helarchaeota archaeon]|nr:hypothetical protein [Candidatus Helarchaeota archaeon]
MPGIAHLLFGLFLVIPIMYIARDRLNWKVALIFVLNNWNGPDAFWPYGFLPLDMHAILSYVLWCIPLALYYSYLSRFSFRRKGKFFEVVDDGRREVKWRNAYILCIAGGISHTFVDTLFHLGMNIHVFQDWHIPFENVLWFGVSSLNISESLIILGYVIMTIVSLLIMYFLNRDLKDIFYFLIAAIVFLFLIHFILGGDVFGGELDVSVVMFMGLFLFIPLCLLSYAANDVNENPVTEPETPIMDVNLNYKLISILALGISVAFVVLGLIGIISPDIIGRLFGLGEDLEEIITSFGLLIGSGFTLEDSLIIIMLSEELTLGKIISLMTLQNFTYMLPIIGVIVLISASIGVIGSIGLFTKKKIFRYFVISPLLLLFFFVFPMAIILFLCQDDVKALFHD